MIFKTKQKSIYTLTLSFFLMSIAIQDDLVLLQKSKQKDKVILALEERGFCVALVESGKTEKKEARNIEDFKEMVDKSSVSWVDYVVNDIKKDSPKAAQAMGFSESLVTSVLKNKRSGYEDFDNELGIMLPAIIVDGFKVTLQPLVILIKNGLVLTLHTTESKRFFRLRRYAETFVKKIKKNSLPSDKLTMVLIRILDENNGRNFDHLREIEEKSDKLSSKLADATISRSIIGPEIHDMKHALITYLGGLWAVIDVLNALRYGDPELLTDDPKILARLGGLAAEVNLHIGLTEHLSQVLASGLEVLQSIYNNQLQILNNKLALLVGYLTILGTAAMVPNTLATVLSNPVYDLHPSDMWWYTALIIGSTIISTAVAYGWVKSKGLLPSRPDA